MAKAKSPPDSPSAGEQQPDIGALARQYVDLWQQQLSSTATDKTMADVVAQSVQLMNTGAAAMASLATAQAPSRQGSETGNDDKENISDGDTRTAPVTASPGIVDPVILELHRRIEQLEKRIAALESGTGGESP